MSLILVYPDGTEYSLDGKLEMIPTVSPTPEPEQVPVPTPSNVVYVDPQSGSDADNGKTTATALRTIPATLDPGSVVILRGGTVIPTSVLPLTLKSGVAYRTDRAWFSGSSWSQPTLDCGSLGKSAIVAEGVIGISITDWRVQNCAKPGIANGVYAIDIENCSDVFLDRLTVVGECNSGIFIRRRTPGTDRNIFVQNCDVSRVAWGIALGTVVGGYQENISICYNSLHDFASQIGDGVHADGIYFYCEDSANQGKRNWQIYNNKFYGDFSRSFGASGALTSFISCVGTVFGGRINHNRSRAKVGTSGMQSFLNLGGPSVGVQPDSIIEVDHNSFFLPTGGGNSVYIGNVKTKLHDNIFSKPGSQLFLVNDASVDNMQQCDYNDWFGQGPGLFGQYGGGGLMTYADFKGFGSEVHGIAVDPKFVDPANGNLYLQAGSPCIDAASDGGNIGAF